MELKKKNPNRRFTTPILVFAFIVSFTIFGCDKPASPASNAAPGIAAIPDPPINSMGVFADTDRGLIKIENYGPETGIRVFQFNGTVDLYYVKQVNAFYINVPQSVLSDQNCLFWSDQQAFKTHQFPIYDERDATAIAVNIQKSPNGIFKIPVPDSSRSHPGVLVLKVYMPPGTPDRIYAISISL